MNQLRARIIEEGAQASASTQEGKEECPEWCPHCRGWIQGRGKYRRTLQTRRGAMSHPDV